MDQSYGEELKSPMKNKTWIIVNKPTMHKLVGCKWIFKKNSGAKIGGEVSTKLGWWKRV